MKTAKDILLENIPKDCWWEEMENLTNTPVEFVIKAMESFAAQRVREYKEKLKSEILARFKEHMAITPVKDLTELIESTH